MVSKDTVKEEALIEANYIMGQLADFHPWKFKGLEELAARLKDICSNARCWCEAYREVIPKGEEEEEGGQ